ncbi:hypothetical protein AMTRI_Chr01g130080 [Amborella trichopoda]|nr:integrator complex subunit 9 isoform X2 [Amborella trichopoda]|eukprot:XP_006839162.2 integrator complex subunit 9 isoform X2 [Amborella trichopoda]
MKLTCLNQGKGFYFPPCHMLHICGVQILLEFPLDLSATSVFSPINIGRAPTRDDSSPGKVLKLCKRRKIDSEEEPKFDETTDSNDAFEVLKGSELICAEPWYKTACLHQWDISMIDVVLVSSPLGMLGLPFLTRDKRFSGKVYATMPVAKLGQLMMEELVSMHEEFRQLYGPQEPGCPHWMCSEGLDLLPKALREIVAGMNGLDLVNWQCLYSAADVKVCLKKVHTLRYAEEVCYDNTLIIKPFSSGLEIGSSNWRISGPRRNLMYLTSSVFESDHTMDFDYRSLQGSDVILFSDCSYVHNTEYKVPCTSSASLSSDCYSDRANNAAELLSDNSESLKEMQKIGFICSCAVNSVKAGGCVLISIGRIGSSLVLLEQLSLMLDSSDLKIPIFLLSTSAEEMLAFSNVIPEWLCNQRQQKLYSGEALFSHTELLGAKKIHVFPGVDSPGLINAWQEPCIVFSPHWNLRIGPVVHLLRRWRGNEKCLLVIEHMMDTDIALLPFKPLAMKVLQCSFLSGIRLDKVQPLMEKLQPKIVLYPEDSRIRVLPDDRNLYTILYYTKNETVRIPCLRNEIEAELSKDLAIGLKPKLLKNGSMAIARVKGKINLNLGRHLLGPVPEPSRTFQHEDEKDLMDVVSVENSRIFQRRGDLPVLAEKSSRIFHNRVVHWGSMDPSMLLVALEERGINGTLVKHETSSGFSCKIHVSEPNKAVIDISGSSSVISTGDESLGALILEAVSSTLDSI